MAGVEVPLEVLLAPSTSILMTEMGCFGKINLFIWNIWFWTQKIVEHKVSHYSVRLLYCYHRGCSEILNKNTDLWYKWQVNSYWAKTNVKWSKSVDGKKLSYIWAILYLFTMAWSSCNIYRVPHQECFRQSKMLINHNIEGKDRQSWIVRDHCVTQLVILSASLSA